MDQYSEVVGFVAPFIERPIYIGLQFNEPRLRAPKARVIRRKQPGLARSASRTYESPSRLLVDGDVLKSTVARRKDDAE